jgi:hypothetical protein
LPLFYSRGALVFCFFGEGGFLGCGGSRSYRYSGSALVLKRQTDALIAALQICLGSSYVGLGNATASGSDRRFMEVNPRFL